MSVIIGSHAHRNPNARKTFDIKQEMRKRNTRKEERYGKNIR